MNDDMDPAMRLTLYLGELLDERPDVKNEEAFYKARNDLDNLHGMKKDAFIKFFDQIRAANKQSLMRNARLLGAEEERIKSAIVECLYEADDDSPDGIRNLLRLTGGVKNGDVKVIVECLDFVDETLAGDIQNCWPKDCGVADGA